MAGNPREEAFADQVSQYWVNFARTGNPNGEGLPDWPAFEPGEAAMMNITFDEASAGPDPWRARLDVTEARADAAR